MRFSGGYLLSPPLSPTTSESVWPKMSPKNLKSASKLHPQFSLVAHHVRICATKRERKKLYDKILKSALNIPPQSPLVAHHVRICATKERKKMPKTSEKCFKTTSSVLPGGPSRQNLFNQKRYLKYLKSAQKIPSQSGLVGHPFTTSVFKNI